MLSDVNDANYLHPVIPRVDDLKVLNANVIVRVISQSLSREQGGHAYHPHHTTPHHTIAPSLRTQARVAKLAPQSRVPPPVVRASILIIRPRRGFGSFGSFGHSDRAIDRYRPSTRDSPTQPQRSSSYPFNRLYSPHWRPNVTKQLAEIVQNARLIVKTKPLIDDRGTGAGLFPIALAEKQREKTDTAYSSFRNTLLGQSPF